MSIRLRLTLWYSGLLTVALAVFSILVYSFVYNNTMSELRSQLSRIAVDTEVILNHDVDLRGRLPQGFDGNNMFLQLVSYRQSITGMVQYKTENMLAGPRTEEITLEIPKQDTVPMEFRFASKQVNGAPFLILEAPVPYKGNVVGLLQVGTYTGREEHLFSQLRTILWISGIAGIVAAFFLGMFFSRKALMPINRVTEAAERIQSGSGLGLRIPREKPNDEIGRLTDTLNGMLSGLEHAYKNLEDTNIAQRRFVSDASHELRTPLTTIRGNVDLLEKIWLEDEKRSNRAEVEEEGAAERSVMERKQMSLESIRDIADEARRMSRLVNDLLSLARADAGYSIEMENMSLRALTEEAARRASFLPRSAEWVVGPLDALEGVQVKGNRDYLLQLLFILIENGFKYTPSGVVRLYGVQSDKYVGLTVSDTGIGMSPEEVPHIFERFYRADVSRGETAGTGLGLSIAKWIADIHHARFEVRTHQGEGTKLTVWFPIVTN
ncbi:sensor histidine kinase [Cohnella sp.]|uniref:sensor histidine kinase n=1 Tax=Cohnella sp. TaxID=1883426 RepID=UPI0035657CD6